MPLDSLLKPAARLGCKRKRPYHHSFMARCDLDCSEPAISHERLNSIVIMQ